MRLDPREYRQLPENPQKIAAGCVLLPTDEKITLFGGSSRDFVKQQGGDGDTFIFILGERTMRGPLGVEFDCVEGVFLSESGPGFHPTWGYEQLLREVEMGGWRVVPTAEVLDSWAERVETRMNL